MEVQKLYRGRLIDHIQLVVKDLQRSRKFYDAVFAVLGIPFGGEGPEFFFFDEFCVSSTTSPAAEGKLTGRVHVAFQARDEGMVRNFHSAGLAAGGTDNGGPGIREKYHPGYFGAFLCDPDGNNIEAVYHGKADRTIMPIKTFIFYHTVALKVIYWPMKRNFLLVFLSMSIGSSVVSP